MQTVKIKNYFTKVLISCGILTITVFASCNYQKKDSAKKDSVQKELREDLESSKLKLIEEIDDALADLDNNIETLENKMEGASEDASQNIESSLEELKADRDHLADQKEKIADAQQETWQAVKSELEALLRNASNSLDSITNNT